MKKEHLIYLGILGVVVLAVIGFQLDVVSLSAPAGDLNPVHEASGRTGKGGGGTTTCVEQWVCINENARGLRTSSCGYSETISCDEGEICSEGICEVVMQDETVCGNGVIENVEECDGLELGGESCAGLGYQEGDLYCYPAGHANECEFDTQTCWDGVPTSDFAIRYSPELVGEPITFTAVMPESEVLDLGGIYYYGWEASTGQGTNGLSRTIERSYTTPATNDYTVALSVIDKNGNQLPQVQKTVTILPEMGFLGGFTVSEGEEIDNPRDMDVEGNYGYVVGDAQRLMRVDISDPSNPVKLQTIDLTGVPSGVDAYGDLVAVAAGSGGVYFYEANAQDPLTQVDRKITYQSGGATRYANDVVFLKGTNYLYVSASGGPSSKVFVFDVSNHDLDTIVSELTFSSETVLNKMDIFDGHLFVSVFNSSTSSIFIYDISGDGSLSFLSSFERPELSKLSDISYDNGILAVALASNGHTSDSYGTGFSLFDVSDVLNPEFKYHAPQDTSHLGLGVRVDNNNMYIIKGSGVNKWNISNPASPIQSNVGIGATSSVVDFENNLLYFAGPQSFYIARDYKNLN